jgi:hypothetical protein
MPRDCGAGEKIYGASGLDQKDPVSDRGTLRGLTQFPRRLFLARLRANPVVCDVARNRIRVSASGKEHVPRQSTLSNSVTPSSHSSSRQIKPEFAKSTRALRRTARLRPLRGTRVLRSAVAIGTKRTGERRVLEECHLSKFINTSRERPAPPIDIRYERRYRVLI